MKVNIDKWPFKIRIEDKIGKQSGKQYQSIGVGFSQKAKDWSETNRKYDTVWFNFFDEDDLLVLASLANTAHAELAKQRQEEHASRQQAAGGTADPFEF